MKIVFMGTSAFAVPVLQQLISSKHKVIGVYTKEPSRQSRGMSIVKSPIYTAADCNNIPVYTPKTFKSHSEVDEFRQLDADITVVAAYGLILPEDIINCYKFGCINIHPSDLPKWRGAAPIQRAMMSGDNTTAICIMKMDTGVDTGPIYDKKQIMLDKTKNFHQLTQEYAELGVKMLLDVLNKIENNNYQLQIQSEIGATYAYKILPIDEKIDFTATANSIHGTIMALTPSAYFTYFDLNIRVIESVLTDKISDQKPGTVITKQLEIVCGDHKVIRITKLQRPGGKVLETQAFLCGYKIPIGSILNCNDA
jgi:methionyl-tRNA formyltransferase